MLFVILQDNLLPKAQMAPFRYFRRKIGAGVICEPFSVSRKNCELLKNVNHKSKFTEKMCELGTHEFSSRILFLNKFFFYSKHM
jgi:hypothetical protein